MFFHGTDDGTPDPSQPLSDGAQKIQRAILDRFSRIVNIVKENHNTKTQNKETNPQVLSNDAIMSIRTHREEISKLADSMWPTFKNGKRGDDKFTERERSVMWATVEKGTDTVKNLGVDF